MTSVLASIFFALIAETTPSKRGAQTQSGRRTSWGESSGGQARALPALFSFVKAVPYEIYSMGQAPRSAPHCTARHEIPINIPSRVE